MGQEMDPALWEYFERLNMTAAAIAQWDQMQYRYGINIDGAGNGDRAYWQMLGGQLVLNQESPQVSWLFTTTDVKQTLRPFEHYVPLRYDLADLASQIEWLRQNDAEAERIASAGQSFAEQYLTYDNVLFYV